MAEVSEIYRSDVNYDVATRDFKFYIFDWDDNILHMPTKIHLEQQDGNGDWHPVEVSTSVFALVRTDPRYRMPPGGRAEAFREFQDVVDDSGDLSFIRDTRAALARVKAGEKPGPSFETLRKTLREGRIFAIVTARGHEPETLREAVKIFIDEVLTPDERTAMMRSLRGYRWWLDKMTDFGTDEEELDYYLSMCRYHAVTNPGFFEQMKSDDDFGGRYELASGSERPELAKEFAIRDFVEHVFHVLKRTGGLGRSVSVGFSDDDAGNVRAVSNYIREELVKRFQGFKFVVYDTSDPSLDRGRKVTVAGQLALPGF
ncbi:MAG: hypothetical protein IKJ45_16635, partial [Kiritimatiellae bacterium]|nr:hypothetical protein [Kiritimatiellia bacterium]